MTTLEIAEGLQEMAERLRREATKPVSIPAGMTVYEADEALSKVFSEYRLDMTVRRWKHDGSVNVSWEVWDGNRSYEAKQLGEAVRKAVAAAAEKAREKTTKPATIEDADIALRDQAANDCPHVNVSDGICDSCLATVDPSGQVNVASAI